MSDINDWLRGDGTNILEGTDNASDIDGNMQNYGQEPLDNLLRNYIRGCTLVYSSATTIKCNIGEVVCANSAGTIRRFRANTSSTLVEMALTTAGSAGLATGETEAASTWYYIYAVADANATTFTLVASTNATTPSADGTYYRKLGAIYNNSSKNIIPFYQVDNEVQFDVSAGYTDGTNETNILAAGTATTFTDVTVTYIPTLTDVIPYLYVHKEGGAGKIHIRTNGSSVTDGIMLGDYRAYTANAVYLPVDSSKKIEYKVATDDSPTADISVLGYKWTR